MVVGLAMAGAEVVVCAALGDKWLGLIVSRVGTNVLHRIEVSRKTLFLKQALLEGNIGCRK